MNLLSKLTFRSVHSGFTLLEALLAFAVLGVVLAATYNLSVRSMRQQIGQRQNYELTAMARALLDEYVQTYPTMATSGVYKGTWEWQISEASQDVLVPTRYDQYFEFVRVTALVKQRGSDEDPLELFTVVAKRASGT